MGSQDVLMCLEDLLRRLDCGINAIELMVYGLANVKDPYADGMFAIWNYLREAEKDIHEALRITGE